MPIISNSAGPKLSVDVGLKMLAITLAPFFYSEKAVAWRIMSLSTYLFKFPMSSMVASTLARTMYALVVSVM